MKLFGTRINSPVAPPTSVPVYKHDFLNSGIPSFGTYSTPSSAVMRVEGVSSIVAANTIKKNSYGLVMQEARTNKITVVNYNPVDTTGVTKVGDANSVLSVVTDVYYLNEAGLSGVCSNSYVYKLDNSAGTTVASMAFTGTTGNAATHCISAYVRGYGDVKLRTAFTDPSNSLFTLNTTYRRCVSNQSTLSAGSKVSNDYIWIQAQPGAVVYAILMCFEEAVVASTPIANSTTSTVTRSADSLLLDPTKMFNPTKGGLAFTALTPTLGNNALLFQYSISGDVNNRISIGVGTTGSVIAQTVLSGTTTNTVIGTVTGGAFISVAITWGSGLIRIKLLGGTTYQITQPSNVSSYNALYVGALSDGSYGWGGAIRCMAYSKLFADVKTLLKGVEIPYQVFDFRNHKSLPPYLSISRNSIAMTATDGRIFQYAAGTPAVAATGIEIFEARTNLLTYSHDFSQSTWTKTGLSVGTGTIETPLNGLFVKTLMETTDTSVHSAQCAKVPTSGVLAAVGVFVKVVTGSATRYLGFRGLGVDTDYPVFDIVNGTVLRTGSQWTAASIKGFNNGWYWCTATCTTASTTPLSFVYLTSTSPSGAQSYTGDTASGFYLAGAQYEEGVTSILTPVFSVGATTNRLADVVTVDYSQLYSDYTGGFAAKALTTTDPQLNQYLFSRRGSTGSDRFLLYRTAAGNMSMYRTNTVDGGATTSIVTVANGTVTNIGMTWKNEKMYGKQYNGTQATGTLTLSQSANYVTVLLGSENGNAYWNGRVYKVVFSRYPEAIDALLVRVI